MTFFLLDSLTWKTDERFFTARPIVRWYRLSVTNSNQTLSRGCRQMPKGLLPRPHPHRCGPCHSLCGLRIHTPFYEHVIWYDGMVTLHFICYCVIFGNKNLTSCIFWKSCKSLYILHSKIEYCRKTILHVWGVRPPGLRVACDEEQPVRLPYVYYRSTRRCASFDS